MLPDVAPDDIEVVEVPTVGQLRRPSYQLSTTLLQAFRINFESQAASSQQKL